jgi:hypothetical protein
MVSIEYIKLPTFTKYQNTQTESSWDSNECSKQQKTESVKKNNSSLAYFPLKHVRNFCWFLCMYNMKSYSLSKFYRSIGVIKQYEKFGTKNCRADFSNSKYVLQP